MLIKRIKAKNFKTYLDLDLDISVVDDKPIILIGGANGGGKTTFFEAINGALYGLKINSEQKFIELLNAGAIHNQEKKIILELHFSGKVLNEEQQYVLTRTYILNTFGQPVESVRLNMNGTIFLYGSATPPAQRAEQEAQVNKIIKANLPQELSRYFLFDAMEAGNLLKEDQLNRVIKENIENVMGFNKYIQMAKSSETLFQSQTAQRIQVENEKQEYLTLLEEKNKKDNRFSELQNQYQDALQYSITNKELYDDIKNGLNSDSTIKNKIEQLQNQIENIFKKETQFREQLNEFIKEIELNIFLPKTADVLKSEINLILKTKAENEQSENNSLRTDKIEEISKIILHYLEKNKLLLNDVDLVELVNHVVSSTSQTSKNDAFDFLEASEVKALENLINIRSINAFPHLNQQQIELNILLNQIPQFENQIESLKSQIAGRDYSIMKVYEENENSIKGLEIKIAEIKTEISKIEKRIHQFDIQTNQEPDPKFETLGKLKNFFEELANKLLIVKKQQIELKMKQDLNVNLAAYQDVIDRVELSENLRNLTFKIYHKAGNEIYLNQLNTASKQVVIQVLLKSLHEFGDYDPPVMIDTVMGVLDEKSRETVLENYFPELSHQTILLSSDSEIRTNKDLKKIEPFISKTFTLKRNRELQNTEVIPGYFGVILND